MKIAWRIGGGAWTLRASEPYHEASEVAVRRAIGDALGDVPEAARFSVGVCAPGVIEPGFGTIVRAANLPGLEGLQLRELMPAALAGAPLRCFTDARAAAFDASEGLTGRSAALVLGTGVGLSVLDDGVPLRVSGESSGHIGQVDLHLPGETEYGSTVEDVLGARALEARHGSPLPELDLPERDPGLRELVRVIRLVHAMYRPQHVLVLGGVGLAFGPSMARVRALAADRLTALASEGWTLRGARDAFHAARGAAVLGGGA